MSNENFNHRIQILWESDLPFFVFRKGGSQTIQVLQQKDLKLHEKQHDTLACCTFSKFENKGVQYFIHAEVYEEFAIDFNSVLENTRSSTFPEVAETDKNSHINLVDDGVSAIVSGELEKVVLSRKREIQTSLSYPEIAERLFTLYPDNHTYFFHHPKVGTWCGSTPEVLLSFSGNILNTVALAGTAIYNEHNEHIWGEKERQEQKIVTDSIISILKSHEIENVQVEGPETVRSGDLIHLKTDISAKVNSDKILSILSDLHPTPAVCGMPKKVARSFILAHENYDREFYTGFFGIVTPDKRDYYVNLRCMQLTTDKAIIYAGGGITLHSNPLQEFIETENKMKSMQRVIR